MTDPEFLTWLRDRLVNVYHESQNTDFVLRLNDIIEREKKIRQLPQQWTDAANDSLLWRTFSTMRQQDVAIQLAENLKRVLRDID